MPQTKTRTKHLKKPAAPRLKVPEENAENSEIPFLAVKVKKDIILDEEEVLPSTEKLEEVSPFGDAAGEEDSGDEEVGLDEEELNPFGDKWEV